MGFLSNIFNKIKSNFSSNDSSTNEVQVLDREVDAAYLEKLEEELIKSDLGVSLALDFIAKLSQKDKLKESDINNMLKEFLLDAFKDAAEPFKFELCQDGLTALLIVGVNGVGKTTSIGKLAHQFKQAGHKVLIAAGDTFRAAAEEQLNIWAERAAVDLIQLEEGAKSSAVVYKAIEQAQNEGHDVLIIDTAGRLQSKQNLMDELSKIREVIDKNLSDSKHKVETMLVLDASTGSNALSQAEKFMAASKVNSIILTKFDGSAKAGMLFSIAYNLKLPVKFVGTGEKLEDIEEFDLDRFIQEILQS